MSEKRLRLYATSDVAFYMPGDTFFMQKSNEYLPGNLIFIKVIELYQLYVYVVRHLTFHAM